MDNQSCDKVTAIVNNTDIYEEIDLSFEEYVDGENISNCEDYGCTCISHEKCCGCILQ